MADVQKPKQKDVPPPNQEEEDLDIDDTLAADSEETEAEKPANKDVPEERAITDPKERARAEDFQDLVSNLLPVAKPPTFSGDESKKDQEFADWKKENDALQAQLKSERDRHVIGPATMTAYKQFKDWLEQGVVPEQLAALADMHLPVPAGCPIELPIDNEKRVMTPDLFRTIAREKGHKFDTKLDTTKIPSEDDFQKIDDVLSWVKSCRESTTGSRNKLENERLADFIKRNDYPADWLKGKEQDPDGWRASARQMVDLASTTRNYVDAMQALFKATDDKYAKLNVEFPPGTKVKIEYQGKVHELTDKELNDPGKRYILKNGTCKEVNLDLPTDLRQENPANAQKIERLKQWLEKNGTIIDQAVGEYAKVNENPDSIIMFGDQEYPKDWRAKFDSEGRFSHMVGPNYKGQPGEDLRACNLVGYDAKVEKQEDGTYKVIQTVKAENAPWYAYQNIRAFGIEQLGKPMEVRRMNDKKEYVDNKYKPDDFVPVKDGSKTSLVQVKNLQNFLDNQKFAYYGEKGLTIAMDAAMVASGTIEVGAAYKAARIGVGAATASLKLTAREAVWEATKGVGRVALGGSGLFNNAGARSTDWGTTVNNTRNVAFLLDISQGLLRSTLRAGSSAKAVEAMKPAEKIHTFIHGKEAANGAEAIKGIPWVKQAHTGTGYVFKGTEIGFAYPIGKELLHQVGELTEKHRDHLKDAKFFVGDGRGNQKAEKGSFDPKNKEALEGARALLDNYGSTLKDGRPAETQKQVDEILAKTKELMGPGATDEARHAYKTELLKKLVFTGQEIQDLEKAHPDASDRESFTLSDQQIKDLMDPDKRREFPKQIREKAEQIMNAKDKDVQAAAIIAMQYLSRDNDGNIADQMATLSVPVESYKRKIITHDSEGGTHEREVTIPARNQGMNLSTLESVNLLKRDLESENLGNRGIVTGESLMRIGAITSQQYAGILSNVLTSEKSSPADKMRALTDPVSPRLATLIDGIRSDERLPQDGFLDELERQKGKSFGLSSQSLLKTLEDRARSDKNPDVRAMSAAMLYGLKEPDGGKEQRNDKRVNLLSAFNNTWQATEAKAKEDFSKWQAQNPDKQLSFERWKADVRNPKDSFEFQVKSHLRETINKPIDERAPNAELLKQRKFDAALSLASITDPNDKAVQLEISTAYAQSLSKTNPVLNESIIKELVPQRLADLTLNNRQVAKTFREDLIKFIGVPDYITQEPAMRSVMASMKTIVSDTYPKDNPQFQAEKDEVAGKLLNRYYGLLDAKNEDTFAKYNPEIRASALYGIANIGATDKDSLNLIRKFVSASPITVAGEEVKANEKDARVRSAAIHALNVAHDKHLRDIAIQLVSTETDPQISQQVRDLRFGFRRIDSHTEEFQALRDNAASKIMLRNQIPAVDAVDFLNQNKMGLVVKDNLISDAGTAADAEGQTYWFPGWRKETVSQAEQKKVEAFEADRKVQFGKLCTLAEQRTEAAAQAKQVLRQIIENSEITGSPGKNLKFAGFKFREGASQNFEVRENPDLQLQAAQKLRELCKSGNAHRDQTAKTIGDLLANGQQIRPEVMKELLGGLKELRTPSTGDPKDPSYKPDLFAMSAEQHAEILAKALDLQLGKPGSPKNDKQTEALQVAIIEEMKKYKHRLVIPTLDAVEERSKFPEVKAAAKAMRQELQESVQRMWDETKANTTSDAAQRAAQVKAALDDKTTKKDGNRTDTSAEFTVQEIFNAYKDYKVKENDVGLKYLSVAMSEQNERVQLAAAMVILKSDLPQSNQERQKAVQVLADLSAKGTKEGFRKDAGELLKPLMQVEAEKAPLAKAYANMALEGGPQAEIARKNLETLLFHNTVVQDFPNGKQVRARDVNRNIVVEELKDGVVVKTSLPADKTYADIRLLDAANNYGRVSVNDRYTAARDVLQRPDVKATTEQQLKALEWITHFVGDNKMDESLRMEAAKMLGTETRLKDDAGVKARERAYTTITELAAHGDKTKAEARGIVGLTPSAAEKAMDITVKALEASARSDYKQDLKMTEEKLKLVRDLHKTDSPSSEARLIDAANYGQKLLGSDNPSVKSAIDSLDRLMVSTITPVTDKNDPRVAALTRALTSGNEQLRISAAWALTAKDLPKDLLDDKAKQAAYSALDTHLKALKSRANEFETASDNKQAAQTWAKIEATYAHLGRNPEEYAYTFATAKRIAAEHGPTDKSLVPLYERLSKQAREGKDDNQAEFFARKAKVAKGEADATAADIHAKPPTTPISTVPTVSAADAAKLQDQLQKTKVMAETALGANDRTQMGEAEVLLDKLAQQIRTAEGATSPRLADALSQLGNLQMQTGNKEKAEKSWREAVAIYEKAGKDLLPDEAIKTTMGLTKFYASSGDSTKYEEYKGKMLNLSKMAGTREVKLNSSDSLMELADYMTSENATKEMQGEAETYLRQALELRSQSSGPNSMDTATAQRALADFYMQGNHQKTNVREAEKLYKQALASQQMQGKGQDWAVTRAKLAHCRSMQGDYEGAFEGYNESLDTMIANGANPGNPQFNETVEAYARQLEHFAKREEAQILRENPAYYVQIRKVTKQANMRVGP